MNKVLGVIIGLIILLIPIYDIITDSTGLQLGLAAITLIKGFLVILLIVIGLAILLYNLNR